MTNYNQIHDLFISGKLTALESQSLLRTLGYNKEDAELETNDWIAANMSRKSFDDGNKIAEMFEKIFEAA